MAKIITVENKDGSKSYQTSVYLGRDPQTGKSVATNLTAQTKKELNLKVSRKKLDFEEHGMASLITKDSMTFNEVFLMWLDVYENTVKESTFNKTKRIFKNHITPEFGNKLIGKIDVITCQIAINKWFKKTTRYNMILNYSANVFDFAIALELITVNPARRATRPILKVDYTEEKTENVYSKRELQQFFSLFEKDELMQHAFFRLLAFAGLRKGEALALTWKDVNTQLNELKINKALSQGIYFRLVIQSPKNHSSVRTLSLDEKTVKLLMRWQMKQREELFVLGFNSQKNSQLVFSNVKNELLKPTITRKWLLKLYARDTDLIEITTHGFRHTHCILLFEAGRSQRPYESLGY